jgi:hypothetical protein
MVSSIGMVGCQPVASLSVLAVWFGMPLRHDPVGLGFGQTRRAGSVNRESDAKTPGRSVWMGGHG